MARYKNIASENLRKKGIGIFIYESLNTSELRRLMRTTVPSTKDCFNYDDSDFEWIDFYEEDEDEFDHSYFISEGAFGKAYGYLWNDVESSDEFLSQLRDFDSYLAYAHPQEARDPEVRSKLDALKGLLRKDSPKVLHAGILCRTRSGLSSDMNATLKLAVMEIYADMFRTLPIGSLVYGEAVWRKGQSPDQAPAIKSMKRWGTGLGVEIIFELPLAGYYPEGSEEYGEGSVLFVLKKTS